MGSNLVDRIYSWALARKKEILAGFFIAYGTLLVMTVVGGVSVSIIDAHTLFFRNVGLLSGKTAMIIFALTLVPGIARRIAWKHKLVSLLRIYRRYLGILVYVLVFQHIILVAIAPRLPSWPAIPAFGTFELFGIWASFILFMMFATSNDRSVAFLKIWWYRLHRLVYLAMWLIFFHVAIQRMSVWTVLMATIVFATFVSFGMEYVRRRRDQEMRNTSE